jgi:predicted amidohydrolase
MKFASAQTKPVRRDIDTNLKDHYRFIEIAASHGARLILFPEMSITGYEREDAQRLSFTENDPRCNRLKELSVEKDIIIICGAPLKMNNALYIGTFIFKPDNTTDIYTKQYLHPGEEVYFSSSFAYDPVVNLDIFRCSPAICADIDNPEHPEKAYKKNCNVYLPSIFFSPRGIPEAYENLKKYSGQYHMNVLMSNFCGTSWGQPAGGSSAFWNDQGNMIARLNSIDPGILLIQWSDHQWISEIINDL